MLVGRTAATFHVIEEHLPVADMGLWQIDQIKYFLSTDHHKDKETVKKKDRTTKSDAIFLNIAK